jgi:hypothetical protein
VAFTPISAQALVISIDGVIQDPGSYTISGSTVTFDTSISSSCTNDFIVHNGVGIVNEVSDGAVTTAKLGTDAVTTAKILDNNVTVAKLPTTLDISGNTVTLPASVSGLGTGIDVTSQITGVVPSANLGSGTASSSTYLAGDSTYKTITTGTSWQSVETGSTMTAVAGNGYPINTTSNACTVTLPAGSVGDTIELVDYAGTWDNNGVTLTADGSEKIKGSTDDLVLNVERQGVKIVYVDATQGWEAITGVNETAPALKPLSYSTDFLVIAGGAGASCDRSGGGGAGGYRASYNNEASGGGNTSETALTLNLGTVYTVTVGTGGPGNSSGSTPGGDGGASSITGSDITDITTVGGGGGADRTTKDGSAGGSGGGASNDTSATGGAGTANQGYAGGDNTTGDGETAGGGGGAGAVGYQGNGIVTNRGYGGAGVASTITGSSVTYAGGGGGGGQSNTAAGGAGGGGTGGDNGVNGTNGDANTGSGGGGGGNGSTTGGTGGDGVVILRMADARYTGTTTGSPTVATDVGGSGETTITFTGDGSYTG